MEVGWGCGHKTQDIILSHHNESLHSTKCSYFFVNFFTTWLQYVIYTSPLKFAIEILDVLTTELEVGIVYGHQTLEIILSHNKLPAVLRFYKLLAVLGFYMLLAALGFYKLLAV